MATMIFAGLRISEALGLRWRDIDLAGLLEEAGLAPTPEELTPHSLRHTYISLQVALGDDPAVIAQDAVMQTWP